jgi:uncharacterized protein (AIM24 family)
MTDFARLPHRLPPQPEISRLGGLACRIEDGAWPALSVVLQIGQSALLNAKALLWKEPSIWLLDEAAGVIRADGPGRLGFARNGGGEIFPVPLAAGESVEVAAECFLAACGVRFSRQMFSDLGARLAQGAELAMDRFTADHEEAVVWVQAQGAVLERGLTEGEPFDLRPGALLCKDARVDVQAIPCDDTIGGVADMAWLRVTGPGRVAFQTMMPPVREPDGQVPRPANGLRGVAGTWLGRVQG